MLNNQTIKQLAIQDSISERQDSGFRDHNELSQLFCEEESYLTTIHSNNEKRHFAQPTSEGGNVYEVINGDCKETSKRPRKLSKELYNVRKRQNLKRDSQIEAYLQEESTSYGQIENLINAKTDNYFVHGNSLDDDKHSISTANSEQFKCLEDDSPNKETKREDNVVSRSNSPINGDIFHEGRVLFTIYLENEGQCEAVAIYEDENDYEIFLDGLCQKYNMADNAALYFKINLMNMIMESHSNSERVQPYLNKLLEINYNLIMSQLAQNNEEQEISVANYDIGLYDGDVEDMDNNEDEVCRKIVFGSQYLEDLEGF